MDGVRHLPYRDRVAQLVVNGMPVHLRDESVAEVKKRLSSLRRGRSLTLELQDENGDGVWVLVPFGAAVVILP